MVATVFPGLFPTPLPTIGAVDKAGMDSPTHALPRDIRESQATGAAPGAHTVMSRASILASRHAGSPEPPRDIEDEYDPQRPALLAPEVSAMRSASRNTPYHEGPPTDRRPRHYGEPRNNVGSMPVPGMQMGSGANTLLAQFPPAPADVEHTETQDRKSTRLNSSHWE